jgi:hypothetical protein
MAIKREVMAADNTKKCFDRKSNMVKMHSFLSLGESQENYI